MTNNNTILGNSGKLSKIFSLFDLRTINPDRTADKWLIMSAHDTDIIGLNVALNLSSANCIEELYRKGSTSEKNCDQ